jgi:2-polyprenyl-3-methyl-5-hydroxy-6-metoxy-1,4-benzoquinol methylase
MNYATAFGNQWYTYRRTQLDSYTGCTYSRDRLDRCVCGLETLRGKTVLEVGAGAGRFTEILLQYAGTLVAMDLSRAVVANRQNCGTGYGLVQADINHSPLRDGAFDVVICLGVVQHTPSPEATIADLARHVRPGGLLVFDHYSVSSRLRMASEYLQSKYVVRAVLKRIARRRPDLALRATRTITALCDPIRRRTSRHRWLDRFVGRLLPTQCYYGLFVDLPPALLYQWHELDTHDWLTDWFKHFRSREQIRACLEGLGFSAIVCEYAGNGVEARGWR